MSRQFYTQISIEDVDAINSKIHDINVILNSMDNSYYVNEIKRKLKQLKYFVDNEED